MTLKVLLIMLYLKKATGLNDMRHVWILSKTNAAGCIEIICVFNQKPGVRVLTGFTECRATAKVLKKQGRHRIDDSEQYDLDKHIVVKAHG